MGVKVHRSATGHLERIEIVCDDASCATRSPDDKEIIAAGGLIKMGWHCSGGRHLCPDHNPSRSEP
jgi:hypothetical protein